jgi:hypothetical protein
MVAACLQRVLQIRIAEIDFLLSDIIFIGSQRKKYLVLCEMYGKYLGLDRLKLSLK